MLWRWGTLVQNVVIQGAEDDCGIKSTGAKVVVRRVVGVGVGLGKVGAVVGGQGIRNGGPVPQGMGRCQVGRSSAGALGFVSAVGVELDGESRRRVSGAGSLRRGERCERGDDRDGELHHWCLQSFVLIVHVWTNFW